MPYVVSLDKEKCLHCNKCIELTDCPANCIELVNNPGKKEPPCIGCGACVLVCPTQARQLVEKPGEAEITIQIDGNPFRVPGRTSLREALTLTAHQNATLPEDPGLSTACNIGACGSCAVEINGAIKLACHTIVKEGLIIKTALPKDYVPRRKVVFLSGPAGIPQVEAACFTVGCNFTCPQCHNWFITWNGKAEALTPQETARRLTRGRERIGVNRTLITGGECTLNRPWLIQLIAELKRISPDPKARFLVDTNGSLLTHSYIDEIVDAGATDISIDLKGLRSDTFKRVTGLEDANLAERYKETAWEAVRYLAHDYSNRITLSLSIPYNAELITLDELNDLGMRLFEINPSIDVGVVAYKGAFRKEYMLPPRYREMKEAYRILKGVGLTNASAQTTDGFILPSGTFLPARGPY